MYMDAAIFFNFDRRALCPHDDAFFTDMWAGAGPCHCATITISSSFTAEARNRGCCNSCDKGVRARASQTQSNSNCLFLSPPP